MPTTHPLFCGQRDILHFCQIFAIFFMMFQNFKFTASILKWVGEFGLRHLEGVFLKDKHKQLADDAPQ